MRSCIHVPPARRINTASDFQIGYGPRLSLIMRSCEDQTSVQWLRVSTNQWSAASTLAPLHSSGTKPDPRLFIKQMMAPLPQSDTSSRFQPGRLGWQSDIRTGGPGRGGRTENTTVSAVPEQTSSDSMKRLDAHAKRSRPGRAQHPTFISIARRISEQPHPDAQPPLDLHRNHPTLELSPHRRSALRSRAQENRRRSP